MKDRILNVILMALVLVIFALTAFSMYKGAFAFWFDPARDLGLGLANLKKLSLIGHPSGGLAGVFYGPYYIWSISLAEIISKDPRWVWFAFATLPYFTLFPLGLFLFRKYSDATTLLAFWLLFLLSFSYSAQVWNPHPTPIFYLFLLYFASKSIFRKKAMLSNVLATGLCAGLIANYHMSFGSGIILSFFFAFSLDLVLSVFSAAKDKGKMVWSKLLGVAGYGFGVFITYVPFLLFETRHGFNQIKIILNAFVLGITKGVSLNVGHGYSKPEIIRAFFVQGEKLFHIPGIFILLILAAAFAYIAYVGKKSGKERFSKNEIILLTLVGMNALAVLFVYLTTKNPVYDYFFISVEMFFLIPALIIIKKIPVLKYALIIMVIYLFVVRVSAEIPSNAKRGNSPDYESKREAVDLIYKNAGKTPVTVFIYDPAIYTFDFDYIFGMYSQKFGFTPHREDSGDKTVFIILPQNKDQGALESFTTYHTPDKLYTTGEKWKMRDGTVILKREKTN